MNDLTETQIWLLEKLGEGHVIFYSRDGDCGWLSGTNGILDDKDIWALRDRQYINEESDEREDCYGCDKITGAGAAKLAALSLA